MVSQGERIRPLMRGRQEMQVRPLGQGDSLKAKMVTHSSILAWKTPWAGEPGRLHGITESDTTQHTRAAQLCLDFLWGYLPRVFTEPAGGGVQKPPSRHRGQLPRHSPPAVHTAPKLCSCFRPLRLSPDLPFPSFVSQCTTTEIFLPTKGLKESSAQRSQQQQPSST